MEIRVDGNRSTTESWIEAHRISEQLLPAITTEEQRVAEKMGISPEDYRRSKYAGDLTREGLQARALQVGKLIEDWLRTQNVAGDVQAVWLKTYEGKFRVDVHLGGGIQHVFLKEDVVNDLLDSGSRDAQQSLDRLLSANLLSEIARAS